MGVCSRSEDLWYGNPSCNTTTGYRVHYVGYEMPLAVGALSRKSLPDCALENLNCHYARRLL